MVPERMARLSGGMSSYAPMTVIGKTGTLDSIAMCKPPFLKFKSFPVRLLVPSGAMRNDAPSAASRAAFRTLAIALSRLLAVDGNEPTEPHGGGEHRQFEELLLDEKAHLPGKVDEDGRRIEIRVVVHHVDEVGLFGKLVAPVEHDADPRQGEADADAETPEPVERPGIAGDERIGDADEARGERVERKHDREHGAG